MGCIRHTDEHGPLRRAEEKDGQGRVHGREARRHAVLEEDAEPGRHGDHGESHPADRAGVPERPAFHGDHHRKTESHAMRSVLPAEHLEERGGTK